ncbi:MAG: ATP-binding protein [Mycobacteriales bacterium]
MSILPRALRARLAVLFAVSVAVVLAIAVGLLALATGQQFNAAVDTGLRTRSESLQAAVARADLSAVRTDPLAELVAADGRVLAASSSLAGISAAGARGGSVLLPADDRRRALARPVDVERDLPELRGRIRVAAQAVPAPPARSGGPVDGGVSDSSVPTGGQAGSAVLVVGSRLQEVTEAENRLLLLFVTGAPPLAVGLAAAGWLLAGAALRPVAALTARAAQISAADTDQRLPQPPGDDEIAGLARTLNAMLSRIGVGVRREREFVDDAAHELRTPIAVLRGELELALLHGPAGGTPVEQTLRSALAEAERLSRLAEDLLVLARQERATGMAGPVELLHVVRTELDRTESAHALRLHLRGTPVVVNADPVAIGRLLANLVSNAQAAGATEALVTVAADATWAMLSVSDNGPGFSAALLETAFERFTRGDAARTPGAAGAGLGLAIVAAISRAQGGTVQASNTGPLPGATVTVRLAVRQPQ